MVIYMHNPLFSCRGRSRLLSWSSKLSYCAYIMYKGSLSRRQNRKRERKISQISQQLSWFVTFKTGTVAGTVCHRSLPPWGARSGKIASDHFFDKRTSFSVFYLFSHFKPSLENCQLTECKYLLCSKIFNHENFLSKKNPNQLETDKADPKPI